MRRTMMTILMAVWLISTSGAVSAQQRQQPPAVAQASAQPQPSRPQPMYQRHYTWYEFLLKQFNPNNVDYGTLMEQRRRAFLDASVRNPYFNYALCATLSLLLVSIFSVKQRIDYRRAMWITAEMMTDVYNHDRYSRGVADEAINRYNHHIERCNRAVEAAALGSSTAVSDTDADLLRAQLQKVAGDLEQAHRDNAKLEGELQAKATTIVQLSLRIDAMAKKTGATAASLQPIEIRGSDAALVKHINDLQEQLCTERQKNRQLKGA